MLTDNTFSNENRQYEINYRDELSPDKIVHIDTWDRELSEYKYLINLVCVFNAACSTYLRQCRG